MYQRCRFRPTKHVKIQMVERGISKEEIKDAIMRGAKRRQGPKIIASLRRIEIVFIPRNCNIVVLTSYRR